MAHLELWLRRLIFIYFKSHNICFTTVNQKRMLVPSNVHFERRPLFPCMLCILPVHLGSQGHLLKLEFSARNPENAEFIIQDGCLKPPQWNKLKLNCL